MKTEDFKKMCDFFQGKSHTNKVENKEVREVRNEEDSYPSIPDFLIRIQNERRLKRIDFLSHKERKIQNEIEKLKRIYSIEGFSEAYKLQKKKIYKEIEYVNDMTIAFRLWNNVNNFQ